LLCLVFRYAGLTDLVTEPRGDYRLHRVTNRSLGKPLKQFI
jgi:hypothetical protein